jgi:protein-tyrosine kinase
MVLGTDGQEDYAMSRIQDILARAERDGTARRTQSGAAVAEPVPAAPPALAPTAPTAARPAPPLTPASAIEPAFVPRSSSPVAVLPVAAGAVAAGAVAASPALVTTQAQTRTVEATLHPSLVAAIHPHSTVAEQYRAIRTRIAQHEGDTPLRTLMITSPSAGEGKSITAANLALAMAQEYQRTVVLVDADLRAPRIHALFGLEPGAGLAEVVAGQASLDETLLYVPEQRIAILPAGAEPQFPTELLGSTAMRRTLDQLRARFDRVLVDLPAVLPLADVSAAAPMSDGIVMVVRAGVTQRPALDQALAALEGDRVIGVVLNEVA